MGNVSVLVDMREIEKERQERGCQNIFFGKYVQKVKENEEGRERERGGGRGGGKSVGVLCEFSCLLNVACMLCDACFLSWV